MIRLLALLGLLAALAGCAADRDLSGPPPDLGAFLLGHNIVVAPKMQKVPISREATKEEWIEALTQSIDDRFGRYEGTQLYHFGISVEGYALAPPGVPLVATPKSALVINLTVWDDAAQRILNEGGEPKQLLIIEDLGSAPIIGSGLANTREEQLEALAFNAAREIEKWLLRKHREEGWFAPRPGAGATPPAPAAANPDPQAAAAPPEAG